ncbi:MAG TPA: hypothetical protein PLP23_09025 [Panacibacter sp.]|nr:hypothetical protein [Panacibacter sp.]
MKRFKYIIYLLAAIAAPLWIALTNFRTKPDSKTMFALDSTPAQININGANLDSLFFFLSKSIVQNNSERDKGNEQLQTSIKALADISFSNSQILQSLLSKDRNITVSVDPISINPPPTKAVANPPNTNSSYYAYDLKENGPFPLWDINNNIATLDIFLVLNNSSIIYQAFIDSIVPMFSGNSANNLLKDSIVIEPQNVTVIKYQRSPYNDKFYIIGKFIKPERGNPAKVDTTKFRIPVFLLP